MSSEGLPVNYVVGTALDLGPRSTADAANAASSSQAADSAAASADRAWKFSNDAAVSAAAAKTSETNAAAAMTNALSKVTTAEQTVASAVRFNNGTTSLGDSVLQSKTPGANVIIRFKDNDAVEQGALYNTVATGQMTLRWGGTAYSVLFKPDGTVTFPSTVYSGTSRILTEATQLTTQDLNTIVDEKKYFQNSTTNATLARNYPAAIAGTLDVINSHAQASGRTGVTQFYYPWNVGNYYYSRVYLALTDTWSEWDIYEARTKSDARYLQIGAYGLGGGALHQEDALQKVSKIYRINPTSLNKPSAESTYSVLSMPMDGNATPTIAYLFISQTGKLLTGLSNAATSGTITSYNVWGEYNTTVDSNGFLKKASPIVKLFSDGTSELNAKSQGVTTERVAEGVYRISGTLGFNADAEWGGVDGGIEIPTDRNKLPLIWVDYEVDETGDLLIKTFHRVNSTAPKFAQNVKVSYKEGAPIDIPEGRWIDLRVEMPVGEDSVEEPIIDEPDQEEPEEQAEDEFKPEPEPEIIPEPLPAEKLLEVQENGEETAPGENPAPADEQEQ